jgi:hypothetical protein
MRDRRGWSSPLSSIDLKRSRLEVAIPAVLCFLRCPRSESLTPSTHPLVNHNVVSRFLYRGCPTSSGPSGAFLAVYSVVATVPHFRCDNCLLLLPLVRLGFLVFCSPLTAFSSELVPSHGPSSSRSVLRGLSRPLISQGAS